MTVVTIARQLGARGEAVANRLADALGWRLLDRALIERIADELEVAPEQVEAAHERVETFVERLGIYLSEGFPEMLPVASASAPAVSSEATARAARRIVATAAAEGTCVIVGHGAQCVLQGHPGVVHVLLHAPHDVRVQRVRAHFALDEKEALEKVRRSDADRKAYIREHFGHEWLDPTLYDLSIDTGRFGVEGAAELIWEACMQLFEVPDARRASS